VWNPFTATIMSDQIKGRLTEAYDGLLIPSILTRIKTGLACAQVAEVHSILDQLYAKMKTLRKQNTSKLERKLRRENDPNTALELFGISTQIKFLKK
jgi:glutamyl-tRNA reductase